MTTMLEDLIARQGRVVAAAGEDQVLTKWPQSSSARCVVCARCVYWGTRCGQPKCEDRTCAREGRLLHVWAGSLPGHRAQIDEALFGRVARSR